MNLHGQKIRHITSLIYTTLLGALVSACVTTPPPTFYQLTTSAADQLTGVEHGIAIGVGPISLAEYLEQPQIVTRKTEHTLDLSEENMWAEPLKESVTRVVIVNLSNMLATNRVYRTPRRDDTVPLEFRVALDIPHFDGSLNGDSVLAVRWTLFSHDDHVILTKVSKIREPAGGEGYDRLIAAHNRALQKLSQEIAAAIKSNAAAQPADEG